MKEAAVLGLALGMIAAGTSQADTFGSGENTFTIDFVNIGHAGNASDTNGYGAVSYDYRMGTYEISQDAITKATASGLANVTAGAWTGSQPAANITWYEAAAFVNWLNTSTGKTAAYNLAWNGSAWSMNLWSSEQAWQTGGENLFRHKDAYYFLPSLDEWYKAAYYDPDKSGGAGYWTYATGSNTAPTEVASGTAIGSAVYNQVFGQGPAVITNAGGLSPYGTMGQGGNVWEWNESAYDSPNDDPTWDRWLRGGAWYNLADNLQSSDINSSGPASDHTVIGFRVASIPEPSAALLLIVVGGAWMLKRRLQKA